MLKEQSRWGYHSTKTQISSLVHTVTVFGVVVLKLCDQHEDSVCIWVLT